MEGLHEFAEQSPLGFAVVNGEPFAVRYMNPAFRRLTGATQLVLGRPFADAFPWLGGEHMSSLRLEVWRSGEPRCDVDVRPAGESPDAPWWKITVWQVSADGDQSRGLVLQVRDFTTEARERRTENETTDAMRVINERLVLASLREQELTEKAQAASDAKSAFLAMMSHELRTPLAAIVGYQELLADGITGPVTDAQRTQLGRIKSSATHLLTLIEDILTFSRLEAHREVVQAEPLSVAAVLDEAATLVLPLVEAKDIVFTIDAPDPSFIIESDRVKLRQILANLLTNAIKFTDCGEVTLNARAKGGDVVFTLRDTGIGIQPEHLEHIFDPFWQVNQTTTRRVGGAGLGLSVSRRLARLMGGDLTVESTAGVGSTFRLRLPAGHGGER